MSDDIKIEITPEDYEDCYFETDLSRHLDAALDYARNKGRGSRVFVPVQGSPGSGKTSIIKEWLKHRELKNWYFGACRSISNVEVEYYPRLSGEGVSIVSGSDLEDMLTPRTKTVKVLFSSEEIDAVDEDTVIVIDDYDRADQETRDELVNLIQHGQVIDPRLDNNSKIRILKPQMIVVVVDSWNLEALSESEMKLFGF